MSAQEIEQLTTFYVGGELFGIEVMMVQEVTGTPSVVPVPLAPKFLQGLINLRGQIATAVDLSELFNHSVNKSENPMSVVCRIDGNLVSLVVDSIGDVVEVKRVNFETPPETIPLDVRRFVKGIYKMNDQFLSVIDLSAIALELSPTETVKVINS